MPRGRIPRPWYRTSTDSWYVNLDGRRISLGKTKREAHAEFARLMSMRGRGVVAGSRIAVQDLADLWLADCERRLAGATVAHYRSEIGSFCALCGSLQARDLRPYHLTQWVSAHPNWAQSTEHSALSAVKIAVAWGKEQGYLEVNPIAGARKPGITRRAPITLAQATAVMAAARGVLVPSLRLLLTTGLRPGELCSLDGRRIDLATRKMAVTGKRGERTVPIGDTAAEILEPLLADHLKGPILFGQRGPLTVDALDAACKRARRRAAPDGSLDHVTPQTFRGLFATESLRRGVDSALVSRLLGHRDASILLKFYAAPDDAMLKEAMERATATRTSGSNEDNSPGPPR